MNVKAASAFGTVLTAMVTPFNSDGTKSSEIRMWRGPGHFRFCSSTSYHRIELKEGVTAWTLFMPGPQKRDWGFLVNDQWIQNEKYIAQRKESNVKA